MVRNYGNTSMHVARISRSPAGPVAITPWTMTLLPRATTRPVTLIPANPAGGLNIAAVGEIVRARADGLLGESHPGAIGQ